VVAQVGERTQAAQGAEDDDETLQGDVAVERANWC
jgi:hypothetical protein